VKLAMSGAMPMVRSRILTIAGLVFAADRLSKWFVVEWLDLQNVGRIDVISPLLTLVMAWNRGINFGLFNGDSQAMRWVLILLALSISMALVWWVSRRAARGDAATSVLALGAGIVVGGALGNAWDRVQYGAVADFLNMSCCGIANPYAFNIADVAIFAGAALIAWKA
jgi:signal peptidase II